MSGRSGPFCRVVPANRLFRGFCYEALVDLSGDVALQAAHDLSVELRKLLLDLRRAGDEAAEGSVYAKPSEPRRLLTGVFQPRDERRRLVYQRNDGSRVGPIAHYRGWTAGIYDVGRNLTDDDCSYDDAGDDGDDSPLRPAGNLETWAVARHSEHDVSKLRLTTAPAEPTLSEAAQNELPPRTWAQLSGGPIDLDSVPPRQHRAGCQLPTAPPATLTSLCVERQLTVGRIASKLTWALYFFAVSRRWVTVSSLRRCG